MLINVEENMELENHCLAIITVVTVLWFRQESKNVKTRTDEETGYLHVNTKVFLHKLLLTTRRKVVALQWRNLAETSLTDQS